MCTPNQEPEEKEDVLQTSSHSFHRSLEGVEVSGDTSVLGALGPQALDLLFRRRVLLGDLPSQMHVTTQEVAEQAAKHSVSPGTIWQYLRRFRQSGLVGLAPRLRADRGRRRGISSRMCDLVKSRRLTAPDWSIASVWRWAAEEAAILGERPPSRWQVRTLCSEVPAPALLLAGGRESAFRNHYRFTYPMHHDATCLVVQLDHSYPVDVLVHDDRTVSRPKQSKKPFGETRPYLTLAIESASRLVLSARFSYDRPNRFVVAATIRDALLPTEQVPYGGLVDEIWVDNGKELVAGHIWELTKSLGITLRPGPSHTPELRGIVERFQRTLNQRLWSTLPGYVGSNVAKRTPMARAELSLSELIARFWEFIALYHQETHSETGLSPIAYWTERCFAPPTDPRLLDVLLLEGTPRQVLKQGIKYRGSIYWHAALAELVSKTVIVRTEPAVEAPAMVEVFASERWICTAGRVDLTSRPKVLRETVASAQQAQRRALREMIENARATLEILSLEAEEAETARGIQTAYPASSQAGELITSASDQPNRYDSPVNQGNSRNHVKGEKRRTRKSKTSFLPMVSAPPTKILRPPDLFDELVQLATLPVDQSNST